MKEFPLSEIAVRGTPNLSIQPMKALQHSEAEAEAMGKASSHLEVLQKVVKRYFIPSLSGRGPTTSRWMAENL